MVSILVVLDFSKELTKKIWRGLSNSVSILVVLDFSKEPDIITREVVKN